MSVPHFGIVQGRLVPSPPGQLQWFPQDRWEDEFALARGVGIDYIELIAERDHNPENPLWTDKGRARIRALTDQNAMVLHALCNDYVIDHALADDSDILKQNFDLLEAGRQLGCLKYVLPLFEGSELTSANSDSYLEPLRAIADKAEECGMVLCLETVMDGRELLDFFDGLNHSNVGAVFDTGNRIAFGHNLAADIQLLDRHVRHVHIKDKNAANQNVLLGTGLVNFEDVFRALAAIGYNGPYTFETQRGKNPLRTASYNIGLVNYFRAEASDR